MSVDFKTSTEYISVTSLNALMNKTLDDQVGEVFFQGEIAEIKKAASGHLYFCLKDEKSQIPAVMWKGMQHSLKFTPAMGMQVRCHGRPTIYHVSGKLQMMVHFMAEAGEGALQKKFLELKEKLEKEGLFAADRKRPIPFLPRAIGIVTSKTGAVIHDIMVKVGERMPSMKTYLIDVRVQGSGASLEIERAIQRFNRLKNVDVIILARGGGSLEDLWAFNEERTVRAVFSSSIPVICGVGHEVDITLAELAADLRAPTPTAAAEFAVPKAAELKAVLSDYEKRLRNFSRWLEPLVQAVDELHFRLSANFRLFIQNNRLKIQKLEMKVGAMQPDKYLQLLRSKIQNQVQRLQSALSKICAAREAELSKLGVRLEALNPLAILERGYSITECGGKVVRAASEIKPADKVKIILHEGQLTAKVEKSA